MLKSVICQIHRGQTQSWEVFSERIQANLPVMYDNVVRASIKNRTLRRVCSSPRPMQYSEKQNVLLLIWPRKSENIPENHPDPEWKTKLYYTARKVRGHTLYSSEDLYSSCWVCKLHTDQTRVVLMTGWPVHVLYWWLFCKVVYTHVCIHVWFRNTTCQECAKHCNIQLDCVHTCVHSMCGSGTPHVRNVLSTVTFNLRSITQDWHGPNKTKVTACAKSYTKVS
jgi:hypothetical protein